MGGRLVYPAGFIYSTDSFSKSNSLYPSRSKETEMDTADLK